MCCTPQLLLRPLPGAHDQTIRMPLAAVCPLFRKVRAAQRGFCPKKGACVYLISESTKLSVVSVYYTHKIQGVHEQSSRTPRNFLVIHAWFEQAQPSRLTVFSARRRIFAVQTFCAPYSRDPYLCADGTCPLPGCLHRAVPRQRPSADCSRQGDRSHPAFPR